METAYSWMLFQLVATNDDGSKCTKWTFSMQIKECLCLAATRIACVVEPNICQHFQRNKIFNLNISHSVVFFSVRRESENKLLNEEAVNARLPCFALLLILLRNEQQHQQLHNTNRRLKLKTTNQSCKKIEMHYAVDVTKCKATAFNRCQRERKKTSRQKQHPMNGLQQIRFIFQEWQLNERQIRYLTPANEHFSGLKIDDKKIQKNYRVLRLNSIAFD